MKSFDFKLWQPWQIHWFSAALVQRMLPNYRYFAQASGFGDPDLLDKQLDMIWQKLSGMPLKFNAEVQLERLQACVPDPEAFDIYAVYPAADACSALACLLESFIDKQYPCAEEISQLSAACVADYLQFSEDIEEGMLANGETHALFEWELETQREVFEWVNLAKPNKESCLGLKRLVCTDRLSSLAIEY